MVPERSPHRWQRSRWLLLALAIAAVLLMPVEYRAGAQAAHPHAVLQLAWEARHGTPRHHHVRKAIHPCAEASTARQELPTHAKKAWGADGMHDPGSNGDIGDPAAGLRFTSTLLAVALSTWVFPATTRHAVRPDRLADEIPDETVPCPEPPPPRL